MNKIKVSTPGKLMLFGEHSVVYDKPCIVATVDQRFLVTVEKISGEELVVDAPAVGIHERKKLSELGINRISKGLRFIEMTVKKFNEEFSGPMLRSDLSHLRSGLAISQERTFSGGLKVKTENHFSSLYGFGSSAAVTVGLAKALFELEGIKVSNKELFDFCYCVVLDVQGVGSGFDIAAALYGEVLHFVTGGKEIERLKLVDNNLPIVVGYTGVKADTPTLIRQVGELKRKQSSKIEACFNKITGIVKEAKGKIEQGEWERVGELMNENQEKLEELGVSSVELDRLIKGARKAGAYGAKLSGAGGGDCMIAVVSEAKREEVERGIEIAGGEVMRVKLGVEGVRVENEDKSVCTS